jgi:5-methylcytosine-specific restriction endonuclease McrA
MRNELETRCLSSGFHGRENLRLCKAYTDGWFIVVGKIKSRRVELWLDRYAGEGQRRFYYGFRVSGASALQTLTENVSRPYQPVRKFTRKDYGKIKGRRVWQLKENLPHRHFDKPISEDYFQAHRFFGIYDSMKVLSAKALERLAMRAADFISAVICSQIKTVESTTKSQVYPQFEPQVRRVHLARERSPKLAKACKQRDGFRCRVCEQTFEEIYGDLGRGFAESHHLYPLSRKKNSTKTSVDDLVTVCANCHRMLHLMRGREHDLQDLKRRMQAHRS